MALISRYSSRRMHAIQQTQVGPSRRKSFAPFDFRRNFSAVLHNHWPARYLSRLLPRMNSVSARFADTLHLAFTRFGPARAEFSAAACEDVNSAAFFKASIRFSRSINEGVEASRLWWGSTEARYAAGQSLPYSASDSLPASVRSSPSRCDSGPRFYFDAIALASRLARMQANDGRLPPYPDSLKKPGPSHSPPTPADYPSAADAQAAHRNRPHSPTRCIRWPEDATQCELRR